MTRTRRSRGMCRRAAALTVVALAMVFHATTSSANFFQTQTPAPATPPAKNPIAASPKSVKAGSVVFATACAPCHGPRGKGDGVSAPAGAHPADLAAGKFKHGDSDADIFKTIKEGGGGTTLMPSWDGQISDSDIWNTINYIRDLEKKRVVKRK